MRRLLELVFPALIGACRIWTHPVVPVWRDWIFWISFLWAFWILAQDAASFEAWTFFVMLVLFGIYLSGVWEPILSTLRFAL